MNKIIGLIFSSFMLVSCVTPSCQWCKSPFDHQFNKGDCAKLNPAIIEKWQYSEGIPMLIEEVGIRSYKFSFKHPSQPMRTVIYSKFVNFDADFIKIDCPDYYKTKK